MDLKTKKRNDFLLTGFLLTAAISFLIFQNYRGKMGSRVIVQQNGETLYELSLTEDRTGENALRLETAAGYNLLVIEDGKAYIIEADCPDKLCVKQRAISRQGESLICLPHRLVVAVEGEERSEIDAVTY